MTGLEPLWVLAPPLAFCLMVGLGYLLARLVGGKRIDPRKVRSKVG